MAGTLCGGKVQGSYAAKLSSCLNCHFYRLVSDQEGRNFQAVSELDLMLDDKAYSLRRRILLPISLLLGFILALSVNHFLISHHDITGLIGAFVTLIGLFIFFYYFLGKIDKTLNKTAANLKRQVHDRRLAEEVIRASEERYRAITTSALDAILIVDAGDFITFWNPALEKMFGLTSQQVPGKRASSLFSAVTARDKMQTGRQSFAGEGVKGDGSLFPVEISVASVDLGTDWFAVYMIRDMTEYQAAEEERIRLHSQIRQSQKLEAIGTLAGGIAHDFNNILSAILGFSTLARDSIPTGSTLHDDLDQIVMAGQRARALVRQILAFSRQTEQEKSPVEIQLILKEALKLLRPSIPTTIDIRAEIDSQCSAVYADPTQIHQVLMNLCTNAYHAMKDKGGKLLISLAMHQVDEEEAKTNPDLHVGPYVLLTVSDTGCGMDPVLMNRIFEPYFTTKGLGDGTGLGLALVHGIVKSHGGAITVSSELEKGSTFQVYFPPFVEDSVQEQQAVTETALAGGKEHVLVVDDEKPIVELTKKQLELLGYTITTQMSSVEALQLFQTDPGRFDIIITDQTMPAMTGVALAREMKQIRPEIPVILTTGFSEEIREDRLQAMGIDALLFKPVEITQLAVTLRNLLDSKTV